MGCQDTDDMRGKDLCEKRWEVVPGKEADDWGIRREGELAGKSIAQMMWDDDAQEIVKLHNDSLQLDTIAAAIDSILAEAGDERAPISLVTKSPVAEIVTIGAGDSYAGSQLHQIDERTIQGWVDRLRGIRAALKGAQEYSMGIKAYCALHKANFPADEMCPHCAAALEAKE